MLGYKFNWIVLWLREIVNYALNTGSNSLFVARLTPQAPGQQYGDRDEYAGPKGLILLKLSRNNLLKLLHLIVIIKLMK